MKHYLINKSNEIDLSVLKHYINDLNFKVHLKLPAWSADSVRFLLEEFNVNERNSLVLHSYYELALDYKLSGIHLNSWYEDFDHILLAKIRTSKLSISRSCHSIKELQDSRDFDYLVFSPVLNSISKKDYTASISELEIKNILKNISTPVVALGGITPSSYFKLSELGFKGAMLSGYVWDNKTEAKNLKELEKEVA